MAQYEAGFKRQATKAIAIGATVLAVSGAAIGIQHWTETLSSTTSTSTASSTDNSADSSGSSSSGSTSTGSSYKSGSYSATVDYQVPHGQESIAVTAKIAADGTVSSLNVNNSGNDRDSAQFQSNFANAINQAVVGKSLAALNLNVIAGASLTTQAFDNAIAQIRDQATA